MSEWDEMNSFIIKSASKIKPKADPIVSEWYEVKISEAQIAPIPFMIPS